MRIKLMGKNWRVVRRSLVVHDGTCDPPQRSDRTHARGREIVLDRALFGVKELEIITHECLHACAWELLAEDMVERCAREFSKLAWRFGCRRGSCRATGRHGLKNLVEMLRTVLAGYAWRVADDGWTRTASEDIARAIYRLDWRMP